MARRAIRPASCDDNGGPDARGTRRPSHAAPPNSKATGEVACPTAGAARGLGRVLNEPPRQESRGVQGIGAGPTTPK